MKGEAVADFIAEFTDSIDLIEVLSKLETVIPPLVALAIPFETITPQTEVASNARSGTVIP